MHEVIGQQGLEKHIRFNSLRYINYPVRAVAGHLYIWTTLQALLLLQLPILNQRPVSHAIASVSWTCLAIILLSSGTCFTNDLRFLSTCCLCLSTSAMALCAAFRPCCPLFKALVACVCCCVTTASWCVLSEADDACSAALAWVAPWCQGPVTVKATVHCCIGVTGSSNSQGW